MTTSVCANTNERGRPMKNIVSFVIAVTCLAGAARGDSTSNKEASVTGVQYAKIMPAQTKPHPFMYGQEITVQPVNLLGASQSSANGVAVSITNTTSLFIDLEKGCSLINKEGRAFPVKGMGTREQQASLIETTVPPEGTKGWLLSMPVEVYLIFPMPDGTGPYELSGIGKSRDLHVTLPHGGNGEEALHKPVESAPVGVQKTKPPGK